MESQPSEIHQGLCAQNMLKCCNPRVGSSKASVEEPSRVSGLWQGVGVLLASGGFQSRNLHSQTYALKAVCGMREGIRRYCGWTAQGVELIVNNQGVLFPHSTLVCVFEHVCVSHQSLKVQNI